MMRRKRWFVWTGAAFVLGAAAFTGWLATESSAEGASVVNATHFEPAMMQGPDMRKRESADFLLSSPLLVRQALQESQKAPVWPEP